MKKRKQHSDQLWISLQIYTGPIQNKIDDDYFQIITYRTSDRLDFLFIRISSEIRFYIKGLNEKA